LSPSQASTIVAVAGQHDVVALAREDVVVVAGGRGIGGEDRVGPDDAEVAEDDVCRRRRRRRSSTPVTGEDQVVAATGGDRVVVTAHRDRS
jgi:hypothetical protein